MDTLGRLVTNDHEMSVLMNYVKNKQIARRYFKALGLGYQKSKELMLDPSGSATCILQYIKQLEDELKELK